MRILFQHPARYRRQALGRSDVHGRPQQDVLQRGLAAVGLLERCTDFDIDIDIDMVVVVILDYR